MGVTVGEVEAVLKARDEMSAVFDKVNKAVNDMGTGLQDAGEKTQGFGDQFEAVADRMIERLAIFEGIKKTLDFVEDAYKSAGALEDLSRATGVSADGLQRLSYVGAEFGVSSETMTRAVEMLSARLANGDKNATLAVQMLGLSVDQLKSMGPEDAFVSIAEAAGKIDDPMTKAGIAADLFGNRVGRQLIPIFTDLRTKMAEVSSQSIISDGAIKGAHDFDVAVGHMGQTAKAVFVNGMGFWSDQAAKFFSMFTGGSTEIQGLNDRLNNGVGVVNAHADATKRAASQEELFQNAVRQIIQSHVELTARQKEEIETLHMLGESNAEIAKLTGVSENNVAQYVETIKKAQEEQKKFNEAMKELDSVGGAWKQTLDLIDGATVEAIKYYLEAGVSQHALATAYGLTAAQVKAVAAELKEETAEHKAAQKAAEEHTKLVAALYDTIAKNSGSTIEKQIADVHKWEDDLKATLEKAGTDTSDNMELVRKIAKEKLDAIGVDWNKLNAISKAHFKDVYDESQATYSWALQHADQFTREGLGKLHEAMVQARADWLDWGKAADQQLEQAKKKTLGVMAAIDELGATMNAHTYDLSTPEGMAEFKKLNPAATVNAPPEYFKTHTLQEAIAAGLVNLYAGYGGGQGGMPSFAEGGVGDFGQGTLAMLHGHEAIVPLDKGGSGGVAAASLSSPITIYVNGTAADVAKKISEEIMKQLKSIRRFGAA